MLSVASAIFLLNGPANARAPDPTYVFLIQNSGWMEPFFSDSRAEKFDRTVTGFVERIAPPRAHIVIASFNREGDVAGETSPQIVYDGTSGPEADQAVASIQVAHRAGALLANSDYREALVHTVRRILNAQPGLVFMITNNKSAPVGAEHRDDTAVAARTEAFNDLLKSNDALSRVVAWPFPLKVSSRRFQENGLVIYGVAYGDAGDALKERSEIREVREWLGDPPVRLKPLGLDPLVMTLTPGTSRDVRWYADNTGRIYIDGISNGGAGINISGALTNVHYPYVIRNAQLIASWDTTAGVAQVTTQVNPRAISDLQPFASVQGVSVVLHVVSAQRQKLLDDHRYLPGVLSIRLAGLKLGLAPAYVSKMQDMFGNGAKPTPGIPDALPPQTPQIFLNYTGVDHGMTHVPLTLGVHFFPWPLIAMIGAAVLVLIPLSLLVWFGTHEGRYSVMIDGEAQPVGLRPFQSKEINGLRGVYVVSRGFGAPVARPKPPKGAT